MRNLHSMRASVLLLAIALMIFAAGCDGEPVDSPGGDADAGDLTDTHTGGDHDAGGGSDAGGDHDTGGDHDHDAGGDHDHDAGGDHDAGTDTDCVPSEAAWDSHASAIVDTYCSDCHGATPQFGAPFSLTDYQALVDGNHGDRKVDAMVQVLMGGQMPPAGYPLLSEGELHDLVAWASCGEEHPEHGLNLEATAPVWEAPAEPPAGVESFDITAGGYAVGPTVVDDYRCFAAEVPVDEARFIRRIEPIIDDGRVLHHSLVTISRGGAVSPGSFSCSGFPPGDDYLYAWGPGMSPIQFPDGGLRVDPGDTIVLQIHYNNGAGVQGVSDDSGMRVFHAPTEGPEYTMAELGTSSIFIPANSQAEASFDCTVNTEVDLEATWPHMHEIGSEFEQFVVRGDGSEEEVVSLTGWSFHAQRIYHTPMTLFPGDRIRGKCTWDNPYDHLVHFGPGTADEMCFSFLYVTPPVADFCG